MSQHVLIGAIESVMLKNFESFKMVHSLGNIEIEPYNVRCAAARFSLDFKNKYISLLSQYNYDCIYAGCLAFCLLKRRPVIVIKATPRMYQHASLHENINEEFALFNALTILKIKQGYITNKTIIPALVESFRSRSKSDELSIESLVEDMQRLCDAVPDYMPNKK